MISASSRTGNSMERIMSTLWLLHRHGALLHGCYCVDMCSLSRYCVDMCLHSNYGVDSFLLVVTSFSYSLLLHVWFDIPASISPDQIIIHHRFVMGLCVFCGYITAYLRFQPYVGNEARVLRFVFEVGLSESE